MWEDRVSRQWGVVRAIETGLNGSEIAQREETGIRTIYKDLVQVFKGTPFNNSIDSASKKIQSVFHLGIKPYNDYAWFPETLNPLKLLFKKSKVMFNASDYLLNQV